jgi:hypothetical protein
VQVHRDSTAAAIAAVTCQNDQGRGLCVAHTPLYGTWLQERRDSAAAMQAAWEQSAGEARDQRHTQLAMQQRLRELLQVGSLLAQKF